MRSITDMMADSHLFSARPGIRNGLLGLLYASGGTTGARSGFVHLGPAIWTRCHADDRAAAKAVVVVVVVVAGWRKGVQGARKEAVHVRHRRETERHERVVDVCRVRESWVVEHAEGIREERVHHVRHLAHAAKVRTEGNDV